MNNCYRYKKQDKKYPEKNSSGQLDTKLKKGQPCIKLNVWKPYRLSYMLVIVVGNLLKS